VAGNENAIVVAKDWIGDGPGGLGRDSVDAQELGDVLVPAGNVAPKVNFPAHILQWFLYGVVIVDIDNVTIVQRKVGGPIQQNALSKIIWIVVQHKDDRLVHIRLPKIVASEARFDPAQHQRALPEFVGGVEFFEVEGI